MATYSPNLALTLLANGEGAGTWGQTTNTNMGTLIEQAISGYLLQLMPDADLTLTIPNGANGSARNMYIELSNASTLSANRNLFVPTNTKLYYVYNNTLGGFSVTVKVAGQTGVTIPAGSRAALVCNGFDIFPADNFYTSVNIDGGTVDNTPIGSTTPSTGSFTYVNVTGTTIPQNGMYEPSGNTLGLASGGVLRYFVNSTGLHTLAAPTTSGATLVVNAWAADPSSSIQLPTAGSLIRIQRLGGGGDVYVGSRTSGSINLYNPGGVSAEVEVQGGILNFYTNSLLRTTISANGTFTIQSPTAGNAALIVNNQDGNTNYSFSGSSSSGYVATHNLGSAGSGYTIGHNSAARTLELQTNSTSRIVIAGTGEVTVVGKFAVNNATPPTQVTGWGTPVGNAVVANFANSSTLGQCATAIAELIVILKQYGIIGA